MTTKPKPCGCGAPTGKKVKVASSKPKSALSSILNGAGKPLVTFGASMFLAFFLLLQSCSPDIPKAFDKLDRRAAASKKLKNKNAPSKYCGRKFPVTPSEIKEVFKYLPGKPYPVPGESVYYPVDCDSAALALSLNGMKANKVYIKVPTYLQVDTAQIIKETKLKDNAELVEVQNKLEESNKNLNEEKVKTGILTSQVSQLQKKKWLNYIPWVLLFLLLVLYLAKKIR